MSLYRIRNFIITAVLVVLAFVLQTTVFSRIHFLGYAPNLLLVLTFIYGYSDSRIVGMLIGFFSGLLMDVFFCDVIGYHALVFLLIGFVSGIWNSLFYSDDLYIPLLLLVLSDLFYHAVCFVVWYVLKARFELGYYLIRVMLPEFLLTFIAGLLLYKPVSALIYKLKEVPEQ
ncbi:MAG: rod shape-determining protein MreD [Parasporobacterium sp.]|nr:rod shape-determining protein MreD [Parasporobacterium sp.]